MELVWKDPPPRSAHSPWAERLAPLRGQPGRWAMIEQGTQSRVNGLRSRLVRNQSLGGFTFRTHKDASGSYELYARYDQ
jgi:hypothetical protein